jgi:hypothetical protein
MERVYDVRELSLILLPQKGASMKRISVNIYLSYMSLFRDLIMWGQVDPYESERDLSRIRSLVETRGERTIFIDLPKCAKHFDFALSRGKLDLRKLTILGNRDGLPAFMHSTFSRVFDSNGNLWREDPDESAVQAIRQVLLLYKKVQIPCSEEKIRHEVRAFFQLDDSLRLGSSGWFGSEFQVGAHSLTDALRPHGSQLEFFEVEEYPRYLSRLAQRVCDMVVRRFDPCDPETIVGNHGPGAVADQRVGMDKYVFPTWNQQLERAFPCDLHSAANIRTYEFGLSSEGADQGRLRTLPARLIPVNKTQEKPRLIASEPTANQFIQGGLRRHIRRQIDAGILSGMISIQDQSLSRELAIQASKDPLLSTVDLSNASDRLSCWTVERVFRRSPNLLGCLAAARSQFIVDDRYTKTYAMLNKYAHQGNATVFPLQSIVYACLALAAVVWSTPGMRARSDADLQASMKEASRRVRVFGDDIVIPTIALPALSSLLELCQLKVNGDKSHYSGSFAESCGMDAFRGTDVTPVYLASVDDEVKPGDVQSAVDISNACYRAGLINLGNLVTERIPSQIRDNLAISREPGPSTNLFTYSSGIEAKRWRYNYDLQRDEYMTLISRFIPKREKRDGWESLFQWFIESPKPDTKWESGWNTRGRTKLVRRWVPKHGQFSRET